MKVARAGAAMLLAAPPVVIASVLTMPTLSEDAAKQYAAIANHRGAVIGGSALGLAALVLLIAGTIWFALALARRAPRLALAGGVFGVLGALVVMFEDSVAAAMPAVVSGLGPAQATAALERVSGADVMSVLGPLSGLQDVGLALLGVAAVKAGAPRWAGVAIAVGAFVELAGFGTETKGLVIAGFAVLFVGLAIAVRTLLGGSRRPLVGDVSPAPASGLGGDHVIAQPGEA